MNDAQSKSIFLSLTFWGIVAAVLANLGARYGLTIDAAGFANELAEGAGLVVALIGRWWASRPVHIIAPTSTQPQG